MDYGTMMQMLSRGGMPGARPPQYNPMSPGGSPTFGGDMVPPGAIGGNLTNPIYGSGSTSPGSSMPGNGLPSYNPFNPSPGPSWGAMPPSAPPQQQPNDPGMWSGPAPYNPGGMPSANPASASSLDPSRNPWAQSNQVAQQGGLMAALQGLMGGGRGFGGGMGPSGGGLGAAMPGISYAPSPMSMGPRPGMSPGRMFAGGSPTFNERGPSPFSRGPMPMGRMSPGGSFAQLFNRGAPGRGMR